MAASYPHAVEVLSWRTSPAILLLLLLSACAGSTPGPFQGSIERDRAALASYGLSDSSLQCSGKQIWAPGLDDEVKVATDEVLKALARHKTVPPDGTDPALRKEIENGIKWRLIRGLLLGGGFHNLGAIVVRGLKTQEGREVVLFRTGITADPRGKSSCYRSLVEAGGVKHTVNLYSGPMPTEDLNVGEREVIEGAQGTYYQASKDDEGAMHWRAWLRDDPSPENQARVSKIVARLINERVFRPGGKRPLGNMHVHCGGGMHRTGMVFGIIQRCINGVPPEHVSEDYRRHVAWRNESRPGGFEQANLDYIQAFDCSLLNAP